MKLYNTQSQQLEEFTPRDGTVSIYVCGITPYDTTHVGHAATYCSFDVLIRYLEYRGIRVRYCQNVTDIDDDILREGKKRGKTWMELGNEWTAHFIRDMIALNVRPPDFYPRATDVIRQIVEIVSKLIERGVAYESQGSVYFHIASDPSYGELSHLTREEMLPISVERGNFPDDPKKRDPLDFVLWQAQALDEPAWDSPWGAGRPGWHIECSAMNLICLGRTIDIHGGGADLIFPHHESEIAQSVNYTGEAYFARDWMHTAMVGFQGEKMSKSLGNLVMVDQLLQKYTPDSIRLYLASHHYRAPWEFTYDVLDASLRQCTQMKQALLTTGGEGRPMDVSFMREKFERALEDDLNTPVATELLCEFSGEIISHADERRDVTDAQAWLREASSIFGLRLDGKDPEPRVIQGWEKHLTRFQ